MKDIILAIIIGLCSVGALVISMKQMFERSRKEPVEPVVTDGESAPRCPCGAPATHPTPVLARQREDGLTSKDRDMYAGAPRYCRQVSEELPKALCRVHAHLADAKMDEFIYVGIRAIQADCNAKIAKEAAIFEKETLPKFIEDSLTDRERTEKKKNEKKTNGVTNGASNGAAAPSSISLS